ncbi:MAG: hypothetical protein A2506_02775 [Elusimicrobia bacterium RIFOXYD12_FULL_66_9]|nr:MAG: hypothetical protein A2506_02775 [Elusimicrobia bacterium RIFOXYD12_FULL_66_9]
MRNVLVLCGLLAVGLMGAPLRAADPALVAGVEKYLGDEEKAILAAVLIDARAGAEFEADAPEALQDTKTLKLFLDKWRGKITAFAEADSKRANPNLEGTYRNYAEMLTPQIRAYLAKRVPLMPEDARNELIGYLKDINKSLADDGHLSWYSKKVVAGVMDRYRLQLTEYSATPLAQDGKRNGPAAAAALAQQRQEAARVAQAERDRLERERVAEVKPPQAPADKPSAKPKPEPKPQPKPQTPPGQVVVDPAPGNALPPADPATGARGQAGDAAREGNTPGSTPEEIARNAGRIFDGGSAAPGSSGDAVVVGPGGAKLPPLPPSTGGGQPSLVGSIPPPPTSAEEDFMSKIEGQQTKEPSAPLHKYLPAGTGALLLGALGFFLGGPIGALIGAAVGAAVGHQVGKALLR